jgi:hypothetical protein
VSLARGRCNQKLYYASIQLQGLHQALQASKSPETILLEAYGQAVQGHLLDAYGWFLLELAEVADLPRVPPSSLSELSGATELAQPLRGELVELQNLETDSRSWLARLLAAPHHSVSETGRPSQALLASSQTRVWSALELEAWCRELTRMTDRMGDSLDEW